MITLQEAARYEIAASWWASLVFWSWGQELAASYYAWKARRKYARYLWHESMATQFEGKTGGE